MVSANDFKNFIYQKIPLKKSIRNLSKIYGFDSEAYRNGSPFLFATSSGDIFRPQEFIYKVFGRKYRNSNFVVYNLKYETGAILYYLPEKIKDELYNKETVRYKQFRITLYPYKMLRISRGKNSVTFWDISRFFDCSLNEAAKKYLGKSKIDVNPDLFTEEYVKNNWDKIVQYCINDAKLTRDLALVLIRYFNKFGIRVNKLYSPAYTSFQYFLSKSKIVTLDKFWPQHYKLFKYSWYAYKGGKFEAVSLGSSNFYEYDINSAYPYEIANLIDISKARVYYSKKFLESCQYGFLKVKITIQDLIYHPVAIKYGAVNIFPNGSFFTYITKNEYIWLINNNVDVEILDGVWLEVKKIRYPYKTVIEDLFYYKTKYKREDPIRYQLIKKIMNSFYGKMIHVRERNDGKFVGYSGWNDVYGAVITSNVRIRISELQNKFKNSVVCVHTDSIISRRKLPIQVQEEVLGGWKLEVRGKGLIIRSGIYQIEDKVKTRGFKLIGYSDLFEVLESNKMKSVIKLKFQAPLSLLEGVRTHRQNEINKFVTIERTIDLNDSRKRIIIERVRAIDYLKRLIKTIPHYLVNYNGLEN